MPEISKTCAKVAAAIEVEFYDLGCVDGKTRKCAVRVMLSNLDVINEAIIVDGREKVTAFIMDIFQERLDEIIDDEVNRE